MSFLDGKQKHPGWALRTKDGDWLSFAHGWHLAEDAFYTRIFDTQEDAIDNLKDMQGDFNDGIECDVVPAWEPLCGQLRHEVKTTTTVLTALKRIVMFILKMRVQLPDGTITKLPLVWKLETGESVATFETFDKAIEWVTYCLPGHPDIEEVE